MPLFFFFNFADHIKIFMQKIVFLFIYLKNKIIREAFDSSKLNQNTILYT